MRICCHCNKEIPRNNLDDWTYSRRKLCDIKCYRLFQQGMRYRQKMSEYSKGNKYCLGKRNALGKTWTVSRETRKRVSIAKLGRLNPMYGKTTSEKQKQIARKRCLENNPAKTLEAREKLRKNHLKEKSPFWKGGRCNLVDKIKGSYQYRLWRKAVFQRDNWTCRHCNKRSKKGDKIEIHPHHIISFSLILDKECIKTIEQALKCKQLWDVSNGLTLCLECHKKTDSYGKYKSRSY